MTSSDEMTYNSGGRTGLPQASQWGWAKATNINGVIHFTALPDGPPTLGGSPTPGPDSGCSHFCRRDTTERLSQLRTLMKAEKLDYYIVPSEDAHQSEQVAAIDKRREYISGFTGLAATAIVSHDGAYLFTDSRYHLQAECEVDANWKLFKVGLPEVKSWDEWLLDSAPGSALGVDGRLIAHETAIALTVALKLKGIRIVYPQRNLIDQIWKGRPEKSAERVYIHEMRFAGEHASEKLRKLRNWLQERSVTPTHPINRIHSHEATIIPSSSVRSETAAQHSVFVSSLPDIAWLLNLRGGDIPYNPLFKAYLWVGMDQATLFVDLCKVDSVVMAYLRELKISIQDTNEVWGFIRKREFGSGKVIISPRAPYVASLLLTHTKFIVAPLFCDAAKAVKNLTEIGGFRRAHTRDAVALARWLGWLEEQIKAGNTITEWEAGEMLTQYKKSEEYFTGLAFQNISASGANAAFPNYSPTKGLSKAIDSNSPYMHNSGAHYKDGTCFTARTVHFGRPSDEQCEVFTKVLKGHIAIDSAFFPQGTTGKQLDVTARLPLWRDGLNYLHVTGQGVGSFTSVNEGPHGFDSDVPLVPGHVLTNQPGFYKQGSFGVRIGSTLVVTKVETQDQSSGYTWLGFERLTHVPIQTKMVKMELLTKDEKSWLKDHNRRCRDQLTPYLENDKRAIRWIQKESS